MPRLHAVALVLSFLASTASAQLKDSALPQMESKTAPPSQQADVKAIPGTATEFHALTASDVEAFFDGIVPLQLERSDIAGATVLVMQDGNILLKKGYGYSDEKSRKTVDPDTTIFRLASISKLFTWTAIMQLEEQGKLNLDTDINQYLDFPIRAKWGKPITLRNLMTHTGGFEEQNRSTILIDGKLAQTLRDYLIQNQPERIYPPGVIPAYSNYGVGLAGYIVERISHQPYEQYVADHIFTPLGMLHSTFYQPPPKALADLPSQGYRGNTEKPAIGFEIFNPVPAGGLSSTAYDMGRYAQALLNGGTLEGHQILRPETLTRMWTPQFRASNQLPAIGMGFYQTWRNGLTFIGHSGDLVAFHSIFALEPTHKLALFISYNSAGGSDQPRSEILGMFTDRYFPNPQSSHPTFIKLSREELDQIEGSYRSTRRQESTRVKFGDLGGQDYVSVDKDGALTLGDSKDLRGHPAKMKPIAKDLWQSVDGQGRLFAIRDSSGKIVRLAGNFAAGQFERVPWYENDGLVGPLLFLSVAIVLLVLLAPLDRLRRRIFLRRRARPAAQPGTVWLPVMTKLAAAAWVVPALLLWIVVARINNNFLPPTPAWDRYFMLMNFVVGVEILLSLFPIVSGIRAWGRADLRPITKLKFTLVACSFLMLSYVAIHYHLIGTVRV